MLQAVSDVFGTVSDFLECIGEIAWTAQTYACGKTEGFITGFEIGCLVCGPIFATGGPQLQRHQLLGRATSFSTSYAFTRTDLGWSFPTA